MGRRGRTGSGRAIGAAIVAIGIGAGALLAAARPAGAGGGGGVLVADEPSSVFHAGDRVHLRAESVVKSDRTWYGPYRVYLRPDRQGMGLAGLAPAGESAEDVEVGNLTLTRIDDLYVSADITFTLPSLADGGYRVLVCNEGCANPLQIYESTINVGVVPLPTVPETVVAPSDAAVPTSAAPVTARIAAVPPPAPTTVVPTGPATPASSTASGPALVLAFAAGAVAALAARLAIVRARRPRPAPAARRERAEDLASIEVVAVHDDGEPLDAREGSLV